jgi:hypothetical protein
MIILDNLKNNSSTSFQLENFINSNFQEIYDFFYNQTQVDLYKYKKEIKQYLRQTKRLITSLDCSNKINGDFIALMVETCEKLHLVMEFKLFYDYLSKCGYRVGKRLEASAYYCGNIRKFYDYYDKYPLILTTLNEAYISNESEHKEILTTTFINFYLSIIYDFGERNKENILKLKNEILLKYKKEKYNFLDEELVNTIFSINIDNYKKAYDDSIQILNSYLYKNGLITCKLLECTIQIENSQYSEKLQRIRNPIFNEIRKISIEYIMNIGNPDSLHYQLKQGVTIIEEEKLLYKYIFNYGKMHKAKLYSSFDTVIHQLNNKTINIIDWGCGQALATSLLIDYIKEQNLQIDISNIILIEPSSLALSRGLLHIDVLKEKEINIKPVNKDIDSLETTDLIIKNSNITLHLFSNILDVEFFRLDRAFLEKISASFRGMNYFICVSPNINDKRNARLDMFCRYFEDNFETKLISSRNSDITKYKRYEIIFQSQL